MCSGLWQVPVFRGRIPADQNFDPELSLDYIPLGQRPGRPEEIAQAVAFLAKSDYTTGEILKLSGGTCICP